MFFRSTFFMRNRRFVAGDLMSSTGYRDKTRHQKLVNISNTLSSSFNKPASSREYRIFLQRLPSLQRGSSKSELLYSILLLHHQYLYLLFLLSLDINSILFSHNNKFSHLLKRKYKNILGLISMFNRHKSILPSVSIDRDIDNPVLDKPSELVKNLENL